MRKDVKGVQSKKESAIKDVMTPMKNTSILEMVLIDVDLVKLMITVISWGIGPGVAMGSIKMGLLFLRRIIAACLLTLIERSIQDIKINLIIAGGLPKRVT